MPLSKKHQHALTTSLFKFVKSLHLGDTLLSNLRSEYALTEEMVNQVRVSQLPFHWLITKNVKF